jgi:hypothetical protein
MRNKAWRRTAPALLAFSFALTSMMLGADMLTGTWELNIGKSKPEPGFTHTRITLTIEQIGPKTTRWTFDHLTKDKENRRVESVFTFDGQERPIQINGANFMVTAGEPDASTRTVLYKKDGRVSQESTWKLSSDGKVLTLTATHRPEGKQAYDTVFVYEK